MELWGKGEWEKMGGNELREREGKRRDTHFRPLRNSYARLMKGTMASARQ